VLLDLILASTNERVVVVSSRRETLDVIAKYVRERQRSTSAVVMLTGSVKGELRETRKTLFNLKGASGARVCCLVDKMAEGQTLTGASHLVLLDATWNPAIDQQSMDRTHRIGECHTLQACTHWPAHTGRTCPGAYGCPYRRLPLVRSRTHRWPPPSLGRSSA
jgi:SNF2 family DNA or RNA helicase